MHCSRLRRLSHSALPVLAFSALVGFMGGCEVDGFLGDKSKTGYFQHTATETPILTRIDAIENSNDDKWSGATRPNRADLVPSELEYRIAPGDIINIEIFELVTDRTWGTFARQVDQSGNVRLPQPLRDVPAAGLTLGEFEDNIVKFLVESNTLLDPFVTVNLTQGSGLSYTIMGQVRAPNVYPLVRPDLRLDQALARAQGVPSNTEHIYIVRPVSLSPDVSEPFNPDREMPNTTPGGGEQRNLEDILENLNEPPAGGGNVSRDGMLLIDIDDLGPTQPVRVADHPSNLPAHMRRPKAVTMPARSSTFRYIIERDQWVAVQDGDDLTGDVMPGGSDDELMIERIIHIPYAKLISDSSYNVIIRPNDRIYVDPPLAGFVYIEGEVDRPGVFQLPVHGRITLSRLIAASGGFNSLAVPSRISLTRRLGDDKEATVRLNLSAIRKKNEPDVFLKPDDHIIVGTSFWAQPLAVIRNGFRSTYGFGFLLDRNFGNDVFGAPPTNINSR
ncbi:MAG: polysaccharide biosynthesis/export family protein [Phycisphaerales bacterium]